MRRKVKFSSLFANDCWLFVITLMCTVLYYAIYEFILHFSNIHFDTFWHSSLIFSCWLPEPSYWPSKCLHFSLPFKSILNVCLLSKSLIKILMLSFPIFLVRKPCKPFTSDFSALKCDIQGKNLCTVNNYCCKQNKATPYFYGLDVHLWQV